MSRAPQITVVIPAFKRAEALARAVRSVAAQDLEPSEFEVIVVDSSPDDANQRVVESVAVATGCNVRCLRKCAEGPGPSRNLGARHASGQFIAFLDSDCEATSGWLRAGLAAFKDDVGLLQGRVLPEPSVAAGIFAHYIVVEAETPLYETANIFYRRLAFADTAGFTPDLQPTSLQPIGGEDTRVAWQVKRNGWKSGFSAEALVYHEVRQMPVWKWFVHKRLYVFPLIVREFPELRDYFFLRYFYDRAQAAVLLAAAGLALSIVWPVASLLVLPYVVLRTAEPSKTLRGVFKLARAVLYFPRDFASLGLLTASSVRHGTLLL
jgi:glycosyltransferase involved in cell wall biosynthesis